jgi:hypothetical protein
VVLRHFSQRSGTYEVGSTPGEFILGGCRKQGDEGVTHMKVPDRIPKKLKPLVATTEVCLRRIGGGGVRQGGFNERHIPEPMAEEGDRKG